MTAASWALMIFSWGLILALTVFCFVKILTKKNLK